MALIFSFFSLVPGPAYRLFPLHFHSSPTLCQLNLQLGWRSLVNALLGAGIGSGILYAIGWVYLKLRKVEGMGLGDVKLMAMAGAFLGPCSRFSCCARLPCSAAHTEFSCSLVVFRKRFARYRVRFREQAASRAWQAAQIAMRGLEIPFGVFPLHHVAIVTWFYGAQMIRAYLSLFRIPG